jgi:hypothetical protein
MQDPSAPRNDKAMTSVLTKKAYQTDLTITQDRAQFSQIYTNPVFSQPANYFGVTHSRVQYPGGKEHTPSSLLWKNDGSLKISESAVLKHKPVPFVIQ